MMSRFDLTGENNNMFWKIRDPSYPDTLIHVPRIEAITSIPDTKLIKVHLTSGKEFKAYIECLEDLGKMLNLKLSLKK